MSSSKSLPFDLPGFTLPLNYMPKGQNVLFPNALDSNDILSDRACSSDTYREILMMRVMNTITDKPNWDQKVFDKGITSKWREEIAQSGQDVSPKMMDYMIHELQCKAGVFQKKGFVTAFDVAVVKSDVAISKQLQDDLKRAAAPFENIPETQKDYHPRSDNKVVNLVHPSLFPVIYGRTRILPDWTIGLDDCLLHMGRGEVLPVPSEEETEFVEDERNSSYRRRDQGWNTYSDTFQWLPCDVQFTDEEPGCRIISYINNIHPLEHRSLYEAVEKIIARAIPLWDRSLTGRISYSDQRIPYSEVEYLPHPDPKPEPRREDGQDSDSEEFFDRLMGWEKSCPIKPPEPGEFTPEIVEPGDREDLSDRLRETKPVDLRHRFRENGLQVIVKLANIELTPEKPEYEGGTWHVEGQLNERICATAIYYYGCENITQSTLSFRQRADGEHLLVDVGYEQGQHEFLYEVFGFDPDVVDNDSDSLITQDLGNVVCQKGRLLTFPNTVQHRVSPFSLADRSKPGHRKILALFLIDPNQRIISSANVPPQRVDWARYKRNFVSELLLPWIPVELGEMISEDTIPSITMDEAKDYRLELMEERSISSISNNDTFEIGMFYLCEH